MPDDLLTIISRRRTWVTGLLIFFVLFAQLAWVYRPLQAGFSLSARSPARSNSPERAQLSPLPAWFSATSQRDTRTDPVATRQRYSLTHRFLDLNNARGIVLPDWFGGDTRKRSLLQLAQPSLSKRASVVTATVDQVFTYTLVFTIPSGNTLTNVEIEDQWPSTFSDPNIDPNGTHGNYVGPTPLTGGAPPLTPSVSSDLDSISWILPDVANSSGQPYVYQLTYQAKVVAIPLSFDWGNELGVNDATLSWDSGSASDQVTVNVVKPDLRSRQIVVSPYETASNPTPPDSVIEGLRANDVITVFQTLTNTATGHPAGSVSPAYDLSMRYRLPDWLAFESMVSGHADPVTSTGGFGLNVYTQLDWSAASLGGAVPELNLLNPDDSVTLVFRARVRSNVAAGRDNAGQMEPRFYYYPGGVERTDFNLNKGITLRSAAPTVVKTEVDAPTVGETVIFDLITYTVGITMPGSGVTLYTPTIELRDILFDGLGYVSALYTPVGWTAPVTAPDGNDTRITWYWQGGDINSSGTYTFIFVAQDDGFYNDSNPVPLGTQLRNEAQLHWGTHDGWSVIPAIDGVTVNHLRPQIEPNKFANPNSIAQPGQQIVWTINNVRNQGATAWDIVLTDTLPPGFGFVDAYPPGYATTTVGSSVVVTWGSYISLTEGSYLPASPPDDFFRITSTAPITLPASRQYQNNVTVRYSDRQEGQPNRQTYYYTRTVNLGVSANLLRRFKYAAPPDDLRIGDTVLYTTVVSLDPGIVAYWPRFNDVLPRGIHYISPTLGVQGMSLLTLTLGTNIFDQQTMEWYVTTLNNPTASTANFTATFQARVTATDTNDVPLFTSASDMRGSLSLGNRYNIEWNWTDRQGEPYDTFPAQSSNTTGNNVVQPFLVDRAAAKTLIGSGPVQSGDWLTYNLVIYNTGQAPAYDVVISDTLPQGLVFEAYEARVYPYAASSYVPTTFIAPSLGQEDTVGWVFNVVAAGDGSAGDPDTRLVITYTGQITDKVGSGATLVNSAWISDYSSQPGLHLYERTYGDLSGIGTRYSGAPVSVPEAQINKTASVTEVALGDTVVFTVTLPDPALGATLYNVAVTDTMPGPAPGPLHVLSANWSGPAPTLFNVTSSTVSANYDAVSPGSPATIVITARAPVTAVSGLASNVVQVFWDDAAMGGGSHSASDSAGVTIIVPNVRVSKSAPGAAPQGYPLIYTINYDNNGTATAYDVRLTDTLPVSVTYVQFGSSRLITPVAGFPSPLAWELGDLAKNESGTIWVTTTVWLTAPLNGDLVNTVQIHTPTPGDDAVDNQDVITTVVGGSFLQVAKSASPDPVQAGDLLLYTLIVTNDGSLTTTGLVITDRVPSTTTFDSATGGVTPVGGLLTWTPAQIAVGSQAQVTFAVRVDSPLVSGTIIVNDQYGASASNAPPIAPLGPVTVTVHSQPVLVINKTAAAAVDPGDNLVYTIRYRNSGNAVAHNVSVIESYDANVSYTVASPLPDVGDNVWQIGTLTPTVGDYTIVVTTQVGVSVADGTLLTNTALIDSDETAPQNDTAFTRVGDYLVYMPIVFKNYTPPVFLGVNLVVSSIQVGPALPAVGQATRITVTLHNSGTNAVTEDFWVDLYVDPSTTPTVNVLWNHIAPYGKAWLIHDDVPGGGTLVIHTDQPDDADDPDAVYSNWPGWFVSAGQHVLYAQVDAYGAATGLVPEDDETDNVNGPLSVTVVPSSTLNVHPPPIQWQERR